MDGGAASWAGVEASLRADMEVMGGVFRADVPRLLSPRCRDLRRTFSRFGPGQCLSVITCPPLDK